MSQHLFAADWLADPSRRRPRPLRAGLSARPARARGRDRRDLGRAGDGLQRGHDRRAGAARADRAGGCAADLALARATAVAAADRLRLPRGDLPRPGLVQGALRGAFLVGFALWLGGAAAPAEASGGWRVGIPPGGARRRRPLRLQRPGARLARRDRWRSGRPLELVRRRPTRRRGRAARRCRPPAAGVVALVLARGARARPDHRLRRSVGTVSERAEADAAGPRPSWRRPRRRSAPDRAERPEFDNDLGNLFGQISPLEAFGVWPSGDFRVAPGDGAVPRHRLLPRGAARRDRPRDRRSPPRRAAGRPRSSPRSPPPRRSGSPRGSAARPYTAAKALMMVAPVAMLVSARGVLDPGFLARARPRSRRELGRAAARGGVRRRRRRSPSALALANAPVGPREYTPGVGELADRFAGRSVLLSSRRRARRRAARSSTAGSCARRARSRSCRTASGEPGDEAASPRHRVDCRGRSPAPASAGRRSGPRSWLRAAPREDREAADRRRQQRPSSWATRLESTAIRSLRRSRSTRRSRRPRGRSARS